MQQACEKYQKMNDIANELFYEPYSSHRKAHSVTYAIISCFAPERIEICDLHAKNLAYGKSYCQPEIEGENCIFHIYSKSNTLNSQLIRNRCEMYNKDSSEKTFFVLQYKVDKMNNLKLLTACFFDSKANKIIKEELYRMPKEIRKSA